MRYTFREESGALIAVPSGFLGGHAECYDFLEKIRMKIGDGMKRIVVDLADVDKVNSTGIGILAALLTSARNAEADIRFAGMSDHMWNIVCVVGLGRVIRNYPGVTEALQEP